MYVHTVHEKTWGEQISNLEAFEFNPKNRVMSHLALVLPGDQIHHPISSSTSTLTLGPGLRQLPQRPVTDQNSSTELPRSIVTRAGLLGSQTLQRSSAVQRQWVEGNGKRVSTSRYLQGAGMIDNEKREQMNDTKQTSDNDMYGYISFISMFRLSVNQS